MHTWACVCPFAQSYMLVVVLHAPALDVFCRLKLVRRLVLANTHTEEHLGAVLFYELVPLVY